MNARPLLNNQRVRFETHQRGDGQSCNLEDLHLHKTFTDGKRKGWEIEFPLFGNARPRGRTRGHRLTQEEISPIQKEIGKALQPDEERKKLAEDVVKVLQGYQDRSMTVEKAREASQKLSGYFGLDPEFTYTVVQEYKGHLVQFISHHKDRGSSAQFMIVQNPRYIFLGPSTQVFPIRTSVISPAPKLDELKLVDEVRFKPPPKPPKDSDK